MTIKESSGKDIKKKNIPKNIFKIPFARGHLNF